MSRRSLNTVLLTARFWLGVFSVCAAGTLAAAESEEKNFDDYLNMSLRDLLKQKITVASKQEEAVNDAPSVVTVLSRQQILAYGASNLGDLLEQMPAVYRGNLFSLHDSYVSVRGQAADGLDQRTLITLNGRPMREYWTGGVNQPIYRGMPIDAIERIEMIRGPGSVLYGSGAFSDVINIVTRDPEKTPESLRLTAGSFDTQSGEFTSSYKGKSLKGLTTVKANHVGGWDYERSEPPGFFTPDGITDSQKNGWDNASIVSSWTTDNAGLDFFYADIDADSIGPSGTWPGTSTSTSRMFINTYYMQDLSQHWNLRGDFTASNSAEYVKDDVILKQDVKTHNFIYEVTAAGDYTDWDFLSGFSVSRLFGHDRTNTIFVGESESSGNAAWYNGYFQGSYHATKNLDLIAGVQANKPESIDMDYSPRLGVIYQLTSKWGMKLLYGEAFRTASWSDTDSNLPPIFVGNPSIEPEEIATTDFQIFYRDSDLYLAFSLFYSTITDVYLTRNLTIDNGGEIDFSGGEFEWQWNASDEWGYEGSVALQNNENDNGDRNTRYTPEWLIKNGITFNPAMRWHFGVFDNYLSHIDSDLTNTLNPDSKAVHVLSVNAKYDISHWIDNGHPQALQLTITNALEQDPLFQPDEAFKQTFPWRSERGIYLTYLGEF